MSVRQPVRLLDISRLTEAYPLELLADFTTGNFTLINSAGEQINHNKPGKLTVKYGESVLVNAQDMDETIEVTIPEAPTDVTGNAGTATKLATPQNFTIGDAEAKSFDGTAGLAWTLTEIGAAAADHNHDETYLGINANAASATKLATPVNFTIGVADPKPFDGTGALSWSLSDIGAAAADHNHDTAYLGINANAVSATKLATPVNFTIGVAEAKSFDGTASLSWSLSDIGAAEAGHNHDTAYLGINANAVSASKLNAPVEIGLSGVTATAQSFDGSAGIVIPITAIPSSLLTGTIDLSLIPSGALERMVIVENDDARFALTTTEIQIGDIVKVENTGLMYYVKDQSNLANENGYEIYTAGYATSVPWSGVTGKPTFATVATSGSYNDLLDLPTIYQPSNSIPLENTENGSAGTGNTFARTDHRHPAQTTITGNAGSATKLETSRNITIGGATKSFNGTANLAWTLTEIGAAAADHNHDDAYLGINDTAVSATKLANAINITIGTASPKSFDGSADISWSLSDIGAASIAHSHNYLASTGGTISGDLDINGTLTLSTAGNVSGISVVYSATVSTNWGGSSAPYTQTISVNGIRTGDRPIVDFVCSGTYSTDKARETAFANIYRVRVTANNSITLYAHEKTTTSCPIDLFVVR